MLIDAHCHLDRYPQPHKIAKEAEKAGVVIIAMTNLPSHFQRGRSPAAQLRNVRLSLGLHPMLAPHSDQELRLFTELLPSTSFVGEIGLDFTKEGSKNEGAQRQSFDFVLQQVHRKGKILSVHSRKAELAVLEALKKHDLRSAIFHWFTGEVQHLQWIVEAGYFLSVNGAMLRNEKGRTNIQNVPRSQVLLETDGPYSTVASRPAHPRDVVDLVRQLADLWTISAEEVVRLTTENFRRLLRISEAETVQHTL